MSEPVQADGNFSCQPCDCYSDSALLREFDISKQVWSAATFCTGDANVCRAELASNLAQLITFVPAEIPFSETQSMEQPPHEMLWYM